MNDVRLIDANALMKNIGKIPQLRGITYGRMKRAVEETPTIDAVPVVHGRWLTSSYIPDTLICSVCGKRFDMYHYDQKDMPFCLCGAKMDGGADNA